MDYTVNETYQGTDTLVYSICDSTDLCDTATITITVTAGRKPIAIADTLFIDEDAVPSSFNVLANDIDPDNNLDPSTLEIISSLSGAFMGEANNAEALEDSTILIEMAINFNGSDSLKYSISDHTRLSGEAIVYIFVNPSPDPPEVVSPLSVTIEEHQTFDLEM